MRGVAVLYLHLCAQVGSLDHSGNHCWLSEANNDDLCSSHDESRYVTDVVNSIIL